MLVLHLQLAVLLTVAYTCSDASMQERPYDEWKDFFLGFPLNRWMNQKQNKLSQSAPLPQVQEGWFDQKLDHFNSADTRRWKQRFYTDGATQSRYLFVYIGGETGVGSTIITGSAMAYYAKNYNASCMTLQHRFYYDSHPTPDLSTKNLRYLSSEQALADLAAFITAKKAELSAEKVIVFGGSYPGMLAAWFRLKYPHLAQGAVASSAPVRAKVDFEESFEVKVEPLEAYKTGKVCTIAIAKAVNKTQELMASEAGRAKMKKLFNFCDDMDMSNKNDMALFNSGLAFQVVFSTAKRACDRMTNVSLGEPVERYASFINRFHRCNSFSYKDMVEAARNVSWGPPVMSDRQWYYQLCSEFGFFQTSDSNKQPFRGFPVELWLQFCEDVFGAEFTAGNIQRSVRDTNINYGGLDYVQNNVVFVNGGLDSWHRLSIIHSLPNAPAIFMPDHGHCADIYKPEPGDSPSLVKAHSQIMELIGSWLE